MGGGSFVPTLGVWRFYDNSDATAPTALALESTKPTLAYDSGNWKTTVIHIRIAIEETGGAAGSGVWDLEFRQGAGGTWTNLSGAGHWNWADGIATEGDTCPPIAAYLLSTTNSSGDFLESGTYSSSVTKNKTNEFDVAIVPVGANVAAGTDYYFRVNTIGGTTVSGTGYPVVATPTTPALDYTHQGGVNGQGYVNGQRTVEKVIQGNIGGDGYAVSTMSYQSGQLEFTYEGTVAATGFVASQRQIEKLVAGTQYATGTASGTRTVEKVVPSSLASTGYAASGRVVEKFYSGLQTGIGTWNSRLVLPVMLADSEYISAGGTTPTTAQLASPSGKSGVDFQAGYISDDTNPLPAIDLADSDKYTELEWSIIVYGEQTDEFEFRVTNNGTPITTYSVTPSYTIGQLEYVHQGAVAAVASWISQRMIERVAPGTIYGVGYHASDRTVEKTVHGAVYGTGIHASDRTVERVIVTTHLGTGFFVSEMYYTPPSLNYVWTGQIYGEGYSISQKPFSATYIGGVVSDQTWDSYIRGISLNYIYQGAVNSQQSWSADRFIEKIVQATVQGEGYADSQRMIEKLIQGSIQATGTAGAEKTIERLIQGGVFSTNTWTSQKIREMVYIGKVSGTHTFVSQRVIEKIYTGTINAQETWASVIAKGGYYDPEVLFVLDAQDVTYAMSTVDTTQTMGTQDATFTLADEDTTFTMEGS